MGSLHRHELCRPKIRGCGKAMAVRLAMTMTNNAWEAKGRLGLFIVVYRRTKNLMVSITVVCKATKV